ncbi:glycosyltransferase 87 family protein [Nocardia blacklockiae]|uniref:glycosyltransferase 87 family protein n=1 Tax=Nocardia blacklockiae TaxID=480036 RepID=UPI002B4B2A0F|nr:glycosyltransferase 87 family protein [Nocardia blacklockiae]
MSDGTLDNGSRAPGLSHLRPTAIVLALTAVAAVVFIFTTVDPWLPKAGMLDGGLDAHIYRDGAWKILHGHSLYSEETYFGLLYTYTPFSTLAFIPIALFPWGWVTNTWMVLNLGVLFGCVLLSWRLLGYRIDKRLAAISALLSLTLVFIEPVRTTLYYGQINLMLMALVLWDFSRGDRSRLRGLGVGVAAGIKLVPLYFVVQFAAMRQWRSALTAAGVFVGTIVLSGLVLPGDSKQYWTSTFFQSNRIGEDAHPANQSLRGAIAHLTGQHSAPMWLWILVAGGVAALSLVVTAGLYRHGERLLTVTLAGMTACAVSPFAWGHHWVWFVPLLVYLAHRAQTRPIWWIPAVAVLLAIGAWPYHYSDSWVSVGVFLLPPYWPGAQLMMNAYVLIYSVALIGASVLLWRRHREKSRAASLPLGDTVPAAEVVPVPQATDVA